MPERNASMYLMMVGLCLEPRLNRPINGRFLEIWPRAASGHAAAAPPRKVMNWRRFMGCRSWPILTSYHVPYGPGAAGSGLGCVLNPLNVTDWLVPQIGRPRLTGRLRCPV